MLKNLEDVLNRVINETFTDPSEIDLAKVDIKIRSYLPYHGMFKPNKKGSSEIYINAKSDLASNLRHELIHFYLHDILNLKTYKDSDKLFKELLAKAECGEKIQHVIDVKPGEQDV